MQCPRPGQSGAATLGLDNKYKLMVYFGSENWPQKLTLDESNVSRKTGMTPLGPHFGNMITI